jgi:hypothetical protein
MRVPPAGCFHAPAVPCSVVRHAWCKYNMSPRLGGPTPVKPSLTAIATWSVLCCSADTSRAPASSWAGDTLSRRAELSMEARSTTCKAIRAVWCASIANNTASHASSQLRLADSKGSPQAAPYASSVLASTADAAQLHPGSCRMPGLECKPTKCNQAKIQHVNPTFSIPKRMIPGYSSQRKTKCAVLCCAAAC